MTEKVISQVEFEIKQIDQLFQSYADLLEQVQKSLPELAETWGQVKGELELFLNGLGQTK